MVILFLRNLVFELTDILLLDLNLILVTNFYQISNESTKLI